MDAVMHYKCDVTREKSEKNLLDFGGTLLGDLKMGNQVPESTHDGAA